MRAAADDLVDGMPSARVPMPRVARARTSRVTDAKMLLSPADAVGAGDAAGAVLLAVSSLSAEEVTERYFLTLTLTLTLTLALTLTLI